MIQMIQMQLIGFRVYHALLIAHWRVLFQSGSPDVVFRWNCDSGSNKRCASPKSDSDFHQRWISLIMEDSLHQCVRMEMAQTLGFTYKLNAHSSDVWPSWYSYYNILQVHVRWKTYFLVTCTLLAATRTSGSEYNIVRRHCMYFSFGCFQHQSHF